MNTFLNKPNEKTYYIIANDDETDIRYGVCDVNQVSTANSSFSLITTFTDFESWKSALSSKGITIETEYDEQ